MYINTYNPIHKYNGLRNGRIQKPTLCLDWLSGDSFKRGLIARWKSIGDVAALGTVQDISGNGNNGTLVGDAYVNKNGINLDGTGDYLNLSNVLHSNLAGASAITICSRINNTNIPAGVGNFIVGSRIASGNAGIELYMNSSTIVMAGRSQPTDGYQNHSYTFSTTGINKYVSGILDFENDMIYIYLDGILVASKSVTFGASVYTPGAFTVSDTLGAKPDLSSYFNGVINNTQIYNCCMSKERVELNYLRDRRS